MNTPRPTDADRPTSRFVFLIDIARMLKVDSHTIESWVNRNGVIADKERRPASGQLSRCIPEEDAKRCIAAFRATKQIVRPEDLA